MASVLWHRATGLILWIGLLVRLHASPASGIHVDFAAAVPSGAVFAGTPVELLATLRVTSQEGMSRDTLLGQGGFIPRVAWKAQKGTVRASAAKAVLGESTSPPNGLMFVCRGIFTPPSLPGEYALTVFPEADPGKAVTLRIVVEDLVLKIRPNAVTLAPGQETPFSAIFHGPPGTPLSWSTTGGSISTQGVFKAPLQPGIHTVTVQHLPSGKRASAMITVANTFSIQPASQELAIGQSTQFRCAEEQGPVAWSVLEPGGGTIESDGTYKAPRTPGTYSIQATQSTDPSRRAQATVRVSPLTIAITPTTTTLGAGQPIQFEADVSRGSCLWSATEGEITESGLYTAPLTHGTYQVVAASALDPEVRATATVHVCATGLIKIVPEDLTLHIGQTQQFTLPGLTDDAVPSWLVQPPSAGTITENGLFTAGFTPGACSIMALIEDNFSAASVNLIDTRILPDPARVRPDGTLQFSVQGIPQDAPVSWTLLPASSGTISSDGLFTAGSKPGDCRVSASAGGVEASASVRILSALISPEEALVAPGGTVRFKSESFDSRDQPMTWRLLGDQPGALLGQDGVYRVPVQQGIYRISASDPAGNTAQAKVTVGPPSGLLVVPEIHVEQDGMYTIWVRLRANNGRTVDGTFVGELKHGLAYPEIEFPARRLLNTLGVDGPYAIARVSVAANLEDETILFDTRENLGSTEAFSLEESTKAWIQIGEITDIRGHGKNAYGLLESLVVTIPMELASDGDYRIKASLTSEDGTEIDTYSESQARSRGAHAVVLTFDGRRIHARGGMGPWSITSFTVEGPVTRRRDFPGSIKDYDFRMFQP